MTRSRADDAAELEVALHYTGGDTELLSELVQVFLGTIPERRAELREAMASGAARTVERVAHTLKGGLASLGARPAAALAAELERLGAAGDAAAWPAAADRLDRELERAIGVLRTWVDGGTRPA